MVAAMLQRRSVVVVTLMLGGCAGYLPPPPPPMLPPDNGCAVTPIPEVELPAAARGSGRVALLKPEGPEALAMATWARLKDELERVGYEVAPYEAADRVDVPCEDGVCDVGVLDDAIGNPRAFRWLVIAKMADAPSTSTIETLQLDGAQGKIVRRIEFIAEPDDLVLEIAGPRAIATTMAEHDDPRPPPEEAELALAECVRNNNEDPGCPDFRLPKGDHALELQPIEDDVARVIWRDGDVEVALPLPTIMAMLEEISRDDWDERRGEWATARLGHLEAMSAGDNTPWISSRLPAGERDVRMDSVVRAALADGAAEIHRCSGPLLPFVLREPLVDPSDPDNAVTLYLLPDGGLLFPLDEPEE